MPLFRWFLVNWLHACSLWPRSKLGVKFWVTSLITQCRQPFPYVVIFQKKQGSTLTVAQRQGYKIRKNTAMHCKLKPIVRVIVWKHRRTLYILCMLLWRKIKVQGNFHFLSRFQYLQRSCVVKWPCLVVELLAKHFLRKSRFRNDIQCSLLILIFFSFLLITLC